MRAKIKYILLCIMLNLICIGGLYGTKADEISELEGQIDSNQQKYEEVQKELDELKKEKDDLKKYMTSLNKTYDSIQGVISDLDVQIEAKNTEIDVVVEDISNVETTIAEQYESMKLRIKYIYEAKDVSYLDAFLTSNGFGEMFERLEYISSIMEYDRNQMEAYELNLAKAKRLKEELVAEREELASLKSEQQKQIENLNTMMDEATENIASHEEQIEDALAVAEAIEEEIEAQKNTVEKLKEEEERRKREEASGINKNEEKIPYHALDGDVKRMAAIIWCEARGESYEGQLAVGTVVMNRVESPRFPNTVEGVISQDGQFSPYKSGKYAIALSMSDMQQSCIDAAIEVIENGKRTGSWLFFRMKNGIINGTFIGNHVFY